MSRPASGCGTTTVSYSYDANGNNVASTDGRTIAYTAFDKPTSIVKGSHTTAFAYAPDRARFKRTDTDAQGTTTLYLGSVEKITRPGGFTQLKRHIGGVVIETTGPAGRSGRQRCVSWVSWTPHRGCPGLPTGLPISWVSWTP